MSQQQRLFSRYSASESFPKEEQHVINDINDIDRTPGGNFLSYPEKELIQHYVSKWQFEPLVLDVEGVSMQMPKEISVTHTSNWGNQVTSHGVEVKIYYPYKGHPILWETKPTSSHNLRPEGIIQDNNTSCSGYLILTLEHPSTRSQDDIKKWHDKQLELLQEYVQWINNDVETFNKKLPNVVKSAVQARIKRLVANGELPTFLDIPLNPRKDMPPYDTAQVVDIILPLRPTIPTDLEPAHHITPEIYELILKLIRHVGRSFERTPRPYAAHNEEDLRDFICSHLNGYFEGRANSEAFRDKGKTDICIEANNRSAFIAECKVWSGPAGVDTAIEQLFGYSTWRDCKVSLIFFNKTVKGFSSLLDKVSDKLSNHPLKVRVDNATHCDQGEWRHLFKSNDDPGHLITIHTFLLNLYYPSTVFTTPWMNLCGGPRSSDNRGAI